jgi:hypothetical protein
MGTFTWETGLGLLGYGMLLILVGSIIIYKVINYKPKDDKYGN